MNTSVVLFMGADPTGGTFAIDEEFRLVEAELNRFGGSGFRIEADLDVQPQELQALLNRYEPELLHFSGHVTEQGELMLVDREGKGHVVPENLIARIFSGRKRPIRCIVLNACNGLVLAPALQDAAEVIVAMEGMVSVRAAQAFSVRFYEALACGLSVRAAYDQGILEVELAGFPEGLQAQLLEREPGRADLITFADDAAPQVTTQSRTPLPSGSPTRGDIFISYSHKDSEWMSRLSTMLKPLERSIGIEAWDDRRIEASAGWRDEIDEALRRARIAVLLVSPDFLASDFIHGNELPVILAARERGELDVLWCYLAPCLVGETRLSEIQAAHSPMTPLISMPRSGQDDALLQVATRASEILRS